MSATISVADKKKQQAEKEEDLQPFFALSKSSVLHEARAFSDTPLDARRCSSNLTELLCLMSQGETLTEDEGVTIFFGVTKLFQSQDPALRRLVYLVVQNLVLTVGKNTAFIIINCLEKDINGQIEMFRANALRVHSQVIDSSMLDQRARLYTQAIVNPNPHIASSALTAGIRLFPQSPDVIRRWVNEVKEATKSSNPITQFHALHLLYKIHQKDRHAVLRLVTGMIQHPPDSPFARCLLIRYVFTSLGSDPPKKLLSFLFDSLHQRNPMVVFEAAKALTHISSISETQLTPAINVLQEFLSSPRTVQRFAAVRALSNIVNRFPGALTPGCTVELEHLITDSNRGIATLSITTLLKTAQEYSIERLLNSISEFMADIADELKIIVVNAIKTVCLKFPQKFEALLGFLSNALRDEGGYEYKKTIVESMLLLMNNIDRAKELGLDQLCEFIEDCEYPDLSVQILYLLGEKGPNTANPARYIRYIFNRVILEVASVRAAAVSSLSKFGVEIPSLAMDVKAMLVRSLQDEDDEVRDRATLSTAVFENKIEYPGSSSFPFDLKDMEYSLQQYLQGPLDHSFGQEDIKENIVEYVRGEEANNVHATVDIYNPEEVANTHQEYDAFLEKVQAKIPELGDRIFSTHVEQLTEAEAEYQASIIKHIYEEFIVFQFNVQCLLEDQILTDVHVELGLDEVELEEQATMRCRILKCHDTGITITIVRREDVFAVGSIEATLKFTVKDANVDAEDLEYEEGYQDEYQLNDIHLTHRDYLAPVDMGAIKFREMWEEHEEDPVTKRKALKLDSMQECVDYIVKVTGLTAIDDSNVVKTDTATHVMSLAGVFPDNEFVLARVAFKEEKNKTTVRIGAKSVHQEITDFLVDEI